MSLIIETDLGGDPDDFFALCYFIDAGIDLKGIVISPGYTDQIAIAKCFLKQVGLDIPVGSANPDKDKPSTNNFHIDLMKKYNCNLNEKPDDYGYKIIENNQDCELFICGPLSNTRQFLEKNPNAQISKATMQGGYVSYEALAKVNIFPEKTIPKFMGQETIQTFNLNGDVKGGELFFKANITDRRFVSKNVCHTIVYDKKVHEIIKCVAPKTRAGELLREGMDLYLDKHQEKKFHDPSAAVCHLHPEIAQWVRGDLYRANGRYGTNISDCGKSSIIAKLYSYDILWEHLAEGR